MWLDKYINRGFDLSTSLKKWQAYDHHICRRDGACPQTVRSLHDTHCMFIKFPSLDRHKAYIYPHPAIWCMEAGKLCQDTRPFSGGFVYSYAGY